MADKIELRIAPAVETLRSLPAEPSLDFAFIDADKAGYASYVEEILPRLRPGGLMVLDNMLRSGRVLDPQNDDGRAIDALNEPWSPTTGSTWCCSRCVTGSASPASDEGWSRCCSRDEAVKPPKPAPDTTKPPEQAPGASCEQTADQPTWTGTSLRRLGGELLVLHVEEHPHHSRAGQHHEHTHQEGVGRARSGTRRCRPASAPGRSGEVRRSWSSAPHARRGSELQTPRPMVGAI